MQWEIDKLIAFKLPWRLATNANSVGYEDENILELFKALW
jgi:hypothetical protein